MAASTWFHGSQWPPTNHGIIPSRRCTSAMAWPVASTSELDRMPGTSGSVTAERISSVVMPPLPGSGSSARAARTPRGTLGRASGSPATAASGLAR